MRDLTEFLLARYDEEDAQGGCGGPDSTCDHLSGKWLTQAEVNRRIVEAARDYSPELEHGDNGEWAFDLALRSLALPYADHPDYRDEWRPQPSRSTS